jgi:hypothetical protein
MNWEEKMKALQAPFPNGDLEWRISQCGFKDGKPWAKCLVYITNRAIMQRLDKLFKPNGWRNEFKEWKGKAQLCGISIKDGEEWITKWDGADDTAFESIKGGLSDSMKRAAVQWGIGRYLYNAEEHFAKTMADNGEPLKRGNFQKDKKSGKYFYWLPPKNIKINMKDKE